MLLRRPRVLLYKTHEVFCDLSRIKSIVPDFIGGSLPRSDDASYEYYCMTMLTLFKPWRSGSTLKTDEQSWTEAFTKYKFGPTDLQLMKNFNLRYECLDARDDFHSELKKKNKSASKLNRKFRRQKIKHPG